MRTSNTFSENSLSRSNLRRLLLMLWGVFCLAYSANAIDPSKDISQYLRDYWNTSSGFVGGRVNSIVQTPDGYLWIGADKGLIRYDGINFRPFRISDSGKEPVSEALEMVVGGNGDVWVRDQNLHTIRIHDGRSEDVMANTGERESNVSAMFASKDGSVLLSALQPRVYRYSNGKLKTLAAPPALKTGLVLSIAETSDGKVWMGTRDEGLFYVDHGRVDSVKDKLPDRKINCLLAGVSGSFWIGTDNGLAFSNGKTIKPVRLPSILNNIPVLSLLRDRDSNLWIGTGVGLFRMNSAGVTAQDRKKNRPGVAVTALFEDREGNIWVGDTQGIERLRDSTFTTYSIDEGLPSESIGPIFADSSGRVWVAPSDGGLYRIQNGSVEQIQSEILRKHIVYSIAGDRDGIWLGLRTGGLMHLLSGNSTVETKIYTEEEGLPQDSISSVYRSSDGTIWIGTLNKGVSKLKDGKFMNFGTLDGLGANSIASIVEGANGAMWFATSGGLTKFSNGHWKTYTTQQGLPSDDVISLLQYPNGTLWIGTTEGLACMTSNGIEWESDAQGPLTDPILGMALDRVGDIWIATSTRVLRIGRSAALNGQLSSAEIREYGLSDGLIGTEGVRRDRSVIEDRQGRIWFSTNRGVAFVDPSHIKSEITIPIAHVESITSDGNPLAVEGQVKIPDPPRRLVIGYIGLSLSSPDRVQYRYKLEGFDQTWNEPVSKRLVEYTNLTPGTYRFRVKASNKDDSAGSTEASLVFSIEPAFWQTWWFLLSWVMAIVLAFFLFYLLRLQQIARQMNIRFEERLSERMRISRELQDTLVQGFLNASVQLRSAYDTLANNSPAKPLLRRVLELMAQVTNDGRTALQGLRPSAFESRDLEHALSTIPSELALEQNTAFRIVVAGPVRRLLPAVHDAIYMIGREAIANAFRHAKATHIEVELDYASGHLQMVVRDDGCGIDPKVVASGRESHWGLSGMRERANGIGAKLRVWSSSSAGTEVELTLPGRVAYPGSSEIDPIRRFLSRLSSLAIFRKAGGKE